jgi:hypothetical protein
MGDGERKHSFYGLALPICRLRQEKDEHGHVISEILGTCFGIGNIYLMTAGHVINELTSSQSRSIVLLRNPETNIFHVANVMETEILDADVGIIKINAGEGYLWFGRASWSGRPLAEFQHVRAVGYPYALDVVGDRRHIVQRCFKGHLVAHLREYLPDGMGGAPFSAYEISFTAPRGLSGAPLWTITANNVCVHGVVIGNRRSSMLVLSDLSEKESMSLGIAVDILTIRELKSQLLASTIGEFLAANGLLTR